MMSESAQKVIQRIPSSLRDPAGFIFELNGELHRTVNQNYKTNFDLASSSGLYKYLVENKLLVEHNAVSPKSILHDLDTYQILKLRKLPFISYPSEWCFSQLKAAALFTLKLQKIALDYGMTLKDASAFNVQFDGIKPIFIDILSFEKYEDGNPWIAYEQFCKHFLAPLALMTYRDDRLQQLLRIYMDGIPLDLAAELLPLRGYLNWSLLTNIVLQAKAQKWFSNYTPDTVPAIKKHALTALIDNLYFSIEHMKMPKRDSLWKNYYKELCIYSNEAMLSKQRVVDKLIDEARPKILWDLGANDGKFSRIASQKNIYTISIDSDHNSVERNYMLAHKDNDANLLPLLMDIANPSPAQGWANCETKSLIDRGPADTILALALIHHLVISHSLSLSSIAAAFSSMCNTLIIEFIPANDPQMLSLLKPNPDPLLHERYSKEIFEKEFKKYFAKLEQSEIEDSARVIYFAQKT